MKTELIKLQTLNLNNGNIQARVFDQTNVHVIHYLVNFYCYDREQMVAGFSRSKNNYRVFLRYDEYFNKNPGSYKRQFKQKEFTSFKKAVDYLIKSIDEYQVPEKSKMANR